MKVRYSYKGFKCPFRAKVWDLHPYHQRERVISGFIETEDYLEYPFCELDDEGELTYWMFCEPIEELKEEEL